MLYAKERVQGSEGIRGKNMGKTELGKGGRGKKEREARRENREGNSTTVPLPNTHTLPFRLEAPGFQAISHYNSTQVVTCIFTRI